MENPTSSNRNDVAEEGFEDAFDEFRFHDSVDTFDGNNFDSERKLSPASILRRRRIISHRPFAGSADSSAPSSSVSVEVTKSERNSENLGKDKLKTFPERLENKETSTITSGSNEKVHELVENVSDSDLDKDNLENGTESLIEENKELSTITDGSNEIVDDSVRDVLGPGEIEDTDSNILLSLFGLMSKVIGFQIHLFIFFVTSPIGLINNLYMFVMDPFGEIIRCQKCIVEKMKRVWRFTCESASPIVYEWLMEHKSIWKLGLRCGWGFLWSIYVCTVLIGLLMVGFVIGGLVMKGLVQEPVRVKEPLNFDYTEKSPVAYLPLVGAPEGDFGVHYVEDLEFQKFTGARAIPSKHKLRVKVALTLPESDYNRNLGIFQVKLEFLAADGKTLAKLSRPIMLKFRSDIIRVFLTFLKSVPLMTGYASETQTLNVKFMGFTEGSTPTACLRVTIEQRAEFQHGAGLPEIYSASLKLDSELPLLQRVVWYWKKTLFVWISMTIFTTELIFLLVCCRPLVIPTVKLRQNSSGSNVRHDNPRRRISNSRHGDNPPRRQRSIGSK